MLDQSIWSKWSLTALLIMLKIKYVLHDYSIIILEWLPKVVDILKYRFYRKTIPGVIHSVWPKVDVSVKFQDWIQVLSDNVNFLTISHNHIRVSEFLFRQFMTFFFLEENWENIITIRFLYIFYAHFMRPGFCFVCVCNSLTYVFKNIFV